MNEDMKLKQLLNEDIDIELLFLKYLLDREVTYEKMGEFAKEYTELSTEQKWEFAKFYKNELHRNMFFWQDFLLSVEVPLTEFNKNKNKIDVKLRSFSIMDKDYELYKINVSGVDLEVIDKTRNLADIQFPYNKKIVELDIDDIIEWINQRCFHRTRKDYKQLLHDNDLSVDNLIEMITRTHGLMYEDFIWLRWEDEDIEYKDIKIRD